MSEFVDVDLAEARKNEQIRYIALQVLSYNHIPFNKMDKCFVGVMERKGLMTDSLPNGKNFSRLSKTEQQKIEDFTGEVFEPSTVKYRIDLTSKGVVSVPLMFDLSTNEIIYTDLEVNTFNLPNNLITVKNVSKGNVTPYSNTLTIENFHNNIAIACYSIVNLTKPNLKDLILLNIKARKGTRVFSKEEANLVISEDGDITPFMSDVFVKDWL